MIILIPLPLFFSSTVYGVAGLSGKSDDDSGSDMLYIQTDLRVFSCSLGGDWNDLDLLFRVHSGLVSTLGV